MQRPPDVRVALVDLAEHGADETFHHFLQEHGNIVETALAADKDEKLAVERVDAVGARPAFNGDAGQKRCQFNGPQADQLHIAALGEKHIAQQFVEQGLGQMCIRDRFLQK